MITISHLFYFLLGTSLVREKQNQRSSPNTREQVTNLTSPFFHYISSHALFHVVSYHFSLTGVVLRPSFIYGKRKVDGFEIPLDVIGEPLERLLLAAENFTRPLSSLPASDLLLAPPVSVDDVAYAVINAVLDDDFFGVFTIEQIKEAAAKVRS